MTASELDRKLNAIDFSALASKAIDETKEDLLALNKEQLLEGKNRLGVDITPSYFNDPYFKSPEAAKRYSDWKDSITPNPKRKSGTPNLYINGKFHASIELKVVGEILEFGSAFIGPQIEEKYGENVYGLNSGKRKEYLTTLRPKLIGLIKAEL